MLLIVRELLLGAHGFNEIDRGLPRISRGLLSQRLRQLEELGVVRRSVRADGGGSRYSLTPAGKGLEEVIRPLGEWGARWAFGEPREEELDAPLLLWWICRRSESALPVKRTVVRIDFADDRTWYWLVLGPESASVCLKNPGFDVDVDVRTDRRTLLEVWLGRRPLGPELADGRVQLDGERGPVQTVRSLLARLSPYAVRKAHAVVGWEKRPEHVEHVK
jgi:DNA-binding HxlR family transcriptional regulator